MDGLLVWSLDGVGGGGEDVGEWLGGGGGGLCREGLEISLAQARCEIICIFGEGIAKHDFPPIPTPSTQSLEMCFPAAHAHIYSKPYTRPQRLRAICNIYLSLAFSKREKNYVA